MNKNSLLSRKIGAIIFLFLMALLTTGFNKRSDATNNKIYENIAIEDVNIGNLSKVSAIEKLEKVYQIKPINLSYNERSWSINPEDIDLSYNIEETVEKAYKYTREGTTIEKILRKYNLLKGEIYNIKLNATYDEYKLYKIIEEISKDINKDEIKASILISDTLEIVRTDSKEGIEVNVVKLKEIIYNMIKEKSIDEIKLPINTIIPEITTEDVNSIDYVLGQHSTRFNNTTSRGSNIHVAGKSTSDILLMPGDTFSYNSITGPRTWSNGYKRAKVILNGKYVNGEGGGVCQVSTTIYNAALFAGMEIVEVHNHTFPSKYAAKGKDAAVSYGYTDFKFKNPYNHPVYVKNIIKDGLITTKIYGCKLDKTPVYVQTQEEYKKDKINVDTYRIYLGKNNEIIKKEHVNKSVYKYK